MNFGIRILLTAFALPVLSPGAVPADFVDPRIGTDGAGGRPFVVRAENVLQKNLYVVERLLNGKPLKTPWICHADILAGGELVLKMSDENCQFRSDRF